MNRKQARLQALKRQVARSERQQAGLARSGSRYAWARLAVFVAGAVLSVAVYRAAGAWAGLTGALFGLFVFVILARFHRRVKEAMHRQNIWRAIKLTHIARMKLDWAQLPPPLVAPCADCPAESDLDLTGERSLHRLIDTAISREGSLRLRAWLAAGVPDLEHFHERQALVWELARLPVFRDKLRLNAALASDGSRRRWDGSRLFAWLDRLTPPESHRRLLFLLTALAAINAILFVLNGLALIPALWRVTFLAYAGLYMWQAWHLGDLFEEAQALNDPLNELRAVFAYLETYRYGQNHALCTLCAPFLESKRCPSVLLNRVTAVLSAASLRRNPLLWMLVSAVVPWDLYVAHGLNKSKAAVADRLPRWLDVWFELEALCALANLAYLNPAYSFPDLVAEEERDGHPVFEANALGHPLIPDGERVCNDFVLDRCGELAMITGSNMSGKSTFLRTVGVNLCLAYAGGPVNAHTLRTVPFRLFTCMRVTDSVTDGISYFYAEVKRLRALLFALEENHRLPLLFLIDEIFRGTNNRERLIGSRSYIRALVGQRGAGVLSTHDLELVKLADETTQIRNYHFAETIEDQQMTFDYTLRPGPCPTTNALKIMRMAGLPVNGVD